MATAEQLSACKEYLRVDGDDDDTIIGSLMDSAVAYLVKAGIKPRETKDALYDLAVYGLVLHWYDNRGTSVVGGMAPIPLGVEAIVQQLSLSENPGF